jgi:hypothetical protein
MPETTAQRFDRVPPAWRMAATELGALWCTFMHDAPMWPTHGHYQCRTCGRHYPVPWAGDKTLPDALPAANSARVRPAFRSAALPLLAMLAIASGLKAGDTSIVASTAGASMAFARYTANAERGSAWDEESVEIDASLPQAAKRGRLRAIRRLLPVGRPEYQVLEIAGDQTVKRQVIVRYLSADVKAAEIPSSSVAITPANYKFHYKGAARIGNAVAYAFAITPRKKRDGLIKGELWLDGETGAAVRQSGYLVRNPSIFVKHVSVIRETTLSNGVVVMRVTHLSVDTRLVGRAELTIQERPCADRGAAAGNEER